MRNKTQCFILNKPEDFKRGSGGVYRNGSLCADREHRVWFSRVLDSGKKGTGWYKLEADLTFYPNTKCSLSVYSSDLDTVIQNDGKKSIDDIIRSDISDEEKEEALAEYKRLSSELNKKVFLKNVKGRYVWFGITFVLSGNISTEVNSLKLFFSHYGWANYLPEIYRTENDFICRYLYIFQELYEDMEKKVDGSVIQYTAYNCSGEFLDWLSRWYCIKEKDLWTEEQLRYILANAMSIFRRIGTRQVIEEISELFWGYKPLVVDYYQRENPDFELPPNLSETDIFINPYVFTVVLKEGTAEDNKLGAYKKILDGCKPAHMTANIILPECGYIGGVVLDETVVAANGGEAGAVLA